MEKTAVAKWLETQFLKWRATQSDTRVSMTQFADYLGLTRNTLNGYLLRGSAPTGDNLEKIAARLGPEIYDLLGLVRPITIQAPDAPDAADSAKRDEWAHLIEGVPDAVVETWIAMIRAARALVVGQGEKKK